MALWIEVENRMVLTSAVNSHGIPPFLSLTWINSAYVSPKSLNSNRQWKSNRSKSNIQLNLLKGKNDTHQQFKQKKQTNGNETKPKKSEAEEEEQRKENRNHIYPFSACDPNARGVALWKEKTSLVN